MFRSSCLLILLFHHAEESHCHCGWRWVFHGQEGGSHPHVLQADAGKNSVHSAPQCNFNDTFWKAFSLWRVTRVKSRGWTQHMYFQHTTSARVCNQALSSLRSLDGAVLLQRSSAGGEALQTLRSQCSSLHSLHVSHQTLRWHHRPPAAGFVAKCVTSNSLTHSLTHTIICFLPDGAVVLV